MAEQDWMEYDEDEAVKFIKNYIPQEIKEKYTNDDINYIIDIVYDFYESKGLMEESDNSTIVEIDEDEMVAYVQKQTLKDKIKTFSADDITQIVQGELAYCESIGIFE